MIIAMKKLSAFVFYREYNEFLEKLRELGVVHINVKKDANAENESLAEKLNLIKRYKNSLKFLEKYKNGGGETGEFADAFAMLEEIEKRKSRIFSRVS